MPGIMLALRWSQALLLIPDGEAGGLESAEASAGLTHGNRLEVLGVWLVVGTAFAVTGWVTTGLIEVVSALGAPALLATTFELAVRVGRQRDSVTARQDSVTAASFPA